MRPAPPEPLPFGAIYGAILPFANNACAVLALMLGAQDIHRFGWVYVKVAVPVNVVALIWIAYKRREAWPRVGVAVAVDAVMSIVFLLCGFVFFLWLTQGHYS